MPKYRAGTDSSKQAHKRRSKAKKNAADRVERGNRVTGIKRHQAKHLTTKNPHVQRLTRNKWASSTKSQVKRLRVEGNMSEAEYMKKSR